MDKTSMTLGYLVGRQIAGQRRAVEKQPIAFIYNTLQLPELPKVDGCQFSYICTIGQSQYLYLSSAQLTYEPNGTLSLFFATQDGIWSKYVLTDGEWELKYQKSMVSGETLPYEYVGNLVWSNENTYSHEDGTLYLTGTDPIPVYE